MSGNGINASIPTPEQEEAVLTSYATNKHRIERFSENIKGYFEKTPDFHQSPLPLVHSVRARLKDPEHLRDKLRRKWSDGVIDSTNLCSRITDLAGIRVLHLYGAQFPSIHNLFMRHIREENWFLHEDPKAYSWDPDAQKVFEACGIKVTHKDSYTSVHYVVRPHEGSELTCEIQIRTLFEEIWGEIDHVINYPKPTSSLPCREQLKVLSKLASTGTRLADSIFVTHEEHKKP